MNKELTILYATAASIGFIHTVLGPDHYLPFIAMAKARGWNLFKTTIITFLCGIGHVASSVVIGLIGIAFGINVMKLEALESFRGNIAAWVLIGFGFAYLAWGIHRLIKNKPHAHSHFHENSDEHVHLHNHEHGHIHVHDKNAKKDITPWVIFTIFLFGPCEPLIPILMYPAARNSIAGMLSVTAVFAACTITTMLVVVTAMSFGINFVPLKKLEKYNHVLAGATIFICGLAIQFLGL